VGHEQLQWMYDRYVGAPADRGNGLTLEDHLHQARAYSRTGMGPTDWAADIGLPLPYAEAVFAAAAERQGAGGALTRRTRGRPTLDRGTAPAGRHPPAARGP
jgi:hypothetical protein